MCLSLLVVALLSILNAFAGRGPFITQSPAENVLALQIYLIAVSAPLLFLAAAMEERRQALSALHASEQEARRQYAQLSAIYGSAPVGLAFIDTDLRYVSVNDHLADTNGLPAAAHLGRTPRDVLSGLADDIEPVFRQVIKTGQPIVDVEVCGTTLSQPGVERVWLASHFPVKDGQGAVLGVNMVVQEITARKRAEEEKRRLLHDLGERVKELTALHRAAHILQEGQTTAGWLQELVSVLPPAWQYPEVTAARIQLGELEFATPGFTRTPWTMGAEVVGSDGLRGAIEVVYLEERPAEDEGPFLAEERELIDSLAEMMRSAIDRRRAEEAQRGSEAALRASYDQIQDLVGRLIVAQEAERTRIARELHDDINQQLAALSIALSGLRRRLADGADVRDELARLQQRTVEMSNEVRHLSHELHPGVLQHAGLVAALRAHCAEFRSQHGIEVTLRTEDLDGIRPEVALCLYRVTQEALQNIARHAHARYVRVSLVHTADRLELTIGDDGQGFDLAEVRRAGGLGLISLDERVRLVRGNLRIDTRPQWGTEVWVQVPLGGQEHAPCESAACR